MRRIFTARRYSTPDSSELVCHIDRDGEQSRAQVSVGVVFKTLSYANQRELQRHNLVDRQTLVALRDTINEALADWP